jgi:hypothetical protein
VSHARKAQECFGAFIDQEQKKIVDFDFVVPEKGTVPVASQAMEDLIFDMIMERWRNAEFLNGIVTDLDGSEAKRIKDMTGVNAKSLLVQILDKNHAFKSFNTAWPMPHGKLLLRPIAAVVCAETRR